jgi:thiamine biosynthesis lipoprotein
MNAHTFRHEAMATFFEIAIADQPADYARQAAIAAWRELDRLESELSRYVESSDIARANRIAPGETIAIGEDALECLLIAAEMSLATRRAFDVAYASERVGDGPPFTLDPAGHALTARAERLHLDLGAIGKGYALDRLAAVLADWKISSASLNSGGSTVLALAAPSGATGWPVGLGEGAARREWPLAHGALSGSGLAVKGAHLIDPRSGVAAARSQRVWALAPTAAVADALSTAFFVWTDDEVAAFCVEHREVGAALAAGDGLLVLGVLKNLGVRD